MVFLSVCFLYVSDFFEAKSVKALGDQSRLNFYGVVAPFKNITRVSFFLQTFSCVDVEDQESTQF